MIKNDRMLVRVISKLFMIGIILHLGGCGLGEKSVNGAVFFFQDSRDLERVLAAQVIDCKDDDCPQQLVGMVSMRSSSSFIGSRNSYSSCTASFLDEKTVLTNAHCIPSNLVAGDPCSSWIGVKEPEQNGGKVYRCDKILALGTNSILEDDFALLSITGSKELSFDQMPLSRSIPRHREKLSAWVVDPPQSYMSNYTAKKIECEVNRKNIVFPSAEYDLSKIVILTRCPSMKGNSGSAFYNEDGELAGILNLGHGRYPSLTGMVNGQCFLHHYDSTFQKAADCRSLSTEINHESILKFAESAIYEYISDDKAASPMIHYYDSGISKFGSFGHIIFDPQISDFSYTSDYIFDVNGRATVQIVNKCPVDLEQVRKLRDGSTHQFSFLECQLRLEVGEDYSLQVEKRNFNSCFSRNHFFDLDSVIINPPVVSGGGELFIGLSPRQKFGPICSNDAKIFEGSE